MGVYCCKTEDKEEQQISECVNVCETKPYTLENYNDILKTRPPCMYGHTCPCPLSLWWEVCFKKALHQF